MLAEVSAAFVAELPPIPVLSPDGPGTRRFGILELVSSAGVTWIEVELRDGLLTATSRRPGSESSWAVPAAAYVPERRAAPRRWTTSVGGSPAAVSGQVEDVSTSGLLLRAATAGSVHLPPGIVRTLLHISMPWGDMAATVTTVNQRTGHRLR